MGRIAKVGEFNGKNVIVHSGKELTYEDFKRATEGKFDKDYTKDYDEDWREEPEDNCPYCKSEDVHQTWCKYYAKESK